MLERQSLRFFGKALKAAAVDSQGNVWVASLGDSFVYAFHPDGIEIGRFNGGGIDGPWGLAIDGEDNIWVANFGPLQHGSDGMARYH